jgi:hypothetical protein
MSEKRGIFRILMTGLCAFVPKREIKEVSEGNQMRVLLVESTSRADVMDAEMNHAHEPHVPVLIAAVENVVSSGDYRKPDLIYSEGELAVFYLEGQDLKVNGAQADNLSIFLEVGAGCGCPHPRPTGSDVRSQKHSFEWVPSFEDISPGSKGVDDACLGDSVDSSVVARVELREGEVYTSQLCSQVKEVFLWQYKIPNTPKRGASHRQAAAQVVGFEAFFEETVELSAKNFKGLPNPSLRSTSKDNNEGIIKLVPSDEESEIVVWIMNMPWADILRTRYPEGYLDKPDIHFAHLYKILLDYNEVNVPHLYGQCPVPMPPIHQGNPNCQPVRTAPNANA